MVSEVNGRRWAYLKRKGFDRGAVLLAATGLILIGSRYGSAYIQDLGLNLGADLLGVLAVLYAIRPFLNRAEARRESVLERFDHKDFITRADDAQRRIEILDSWMALLQGGYQRPFLTSLREALERNVEIRMLLLDPDARAAEQRSDDLLRRTNVVENIMGNLSSLHDFRQGLPENMRHNLDIRVYSTLPPVQMYRADDHMVVSFYPVNMTSSNATQYQTSPQSQLGTFVGSKFEELWDAHSTRSLGQYREIVIKVSPDEAEQLYRTQFVTVERSIYISGHRIAQDHVEHGVAGLPVRVEQSSAKGEIEAANSYLFHTVSPASERYLIVRDLFRAKYGHNRHEVLLQLVEA
ncbi:hypothetical protein D5S17_20760 [Pseudonocardiaceae bacterium YIM PH 21723]|nr:hypothetical protein D5S17_20760 [Pseudonocardiaceae bacterium YIM PH 21723]